MEREIAMQTSPASGHVPYESGANAEVTALGDDIAMTDVTAVGPTYDTDDDAMTSLTHEEEFAAFQQFTKCLTHELDACEALVAIEGLLTPLTWAMQRALLHYGGVSRLAVCCLAYRRPDIALLLLCVDNTTVLSEADARVLLMPTENYTSRRSPAVEDAYKILHQRVPVGALNHATIRALIREGSTSGVRNTVCRFPEAWHMVDTVLSEGARTQDGCTTASRSTNKLPFLLSLHAWDRTPQVLCELRASGVISANTAFLMRDVLSKAVAIALGVGLPSEEANAIGRWAATASMMLR